MEFHCRALHARRAILLAGSMLLAAAPLHSASAADVPIGATTVQEAVGWYYYGGLEAGGRFVFDRPPSGFGFTNASSGGACAVDAIITKCFLTASQVDSRAKFEEYGKIPQAAPFLDWINLQAGTLDGRYAFDFWGRNVALNNQAYTLDASKIGEHYVSLGWDQSPHLTSTSAKTVFGGVGSTFLTVDPALQAQLAPLMPTAAANTPAGVVTRETIQNIINNHEHPLELETRRDRATFAYRWTPTPDWDFDVDYSHEDRSGLRLNAVNWGWGNKTTTSTGINPFPTNILEVPQPLKDTTQNISAKAERDGIDIMGIRLTSNVKYFGSFYHDDLKELDVQNPFCTPTLCSVLVAPVNPVPPGTFFAPNLLRWSMPPSNSANGVVWNTAADLPFWKTRYVSTVQFNDMRQNDPFVDTQTNGLTVQPPMLNGVPVGSLNGVVDTVLWNNVLTSQITKDLKFTARGRHFEVDNHTPSLEITNWIRADSGCAGGNPTTTGGFCPPTDATTRFSNPIAYKKDNANAELTWRPVNWASIGGGYFFERWDRHLRDVNITNENMGKVWIDLTPTEIPDTTWGVRARGSYLFAERRYETYDVREFVEEPAQGFSEVASNMRRFDIANRNRQKADVQVDFTPGTIFTISPNFGLRFDEYPDPVFNPLGVHTDRGWNAGLEVGAAIEQVRFTAAYNFEHRRLNMSGGSGGANLPGLPNGCPVNTATTTPNPDNIIGPLCTWFTDITQQYHTFIFAADWKVVPSKFDLRFEYLYVFATEESKLTPCSAPVTVAGNGAVSGPGVACSGLTSGATPASVNFGQFPPEKDHFQRFNIIGRYYVDPVFVRQMGWIGDVVLKVRYTVERNRVNNWAFDNLTPYVATPDTPELTGGSRSLFMAAFNPNYLAQIIAASVVVKW
jgi:MtrB/PioB family decaheme-associated outer membrane protein